MAQADAPAPAPYLHLADTTSRYLDIRQVRRFSARRRPTLQPDASAEYTDCILSLSDAAPGIRRR
jgi:hypothetical protein